VSTVGFILCGVVELGVLLLGRILIGLAAGCALPLTNSYIMELTPKELRSSMGSMNGLGIPLGMVIAFAITLGLNTLDPADEVKWRFAFMFPIITNFLQILMTLMVLTETAHYHLQDKKNEVKARNDLSYIYNNQFVDAELESIRQELTAQNTEEITLNEFVRRYWKSLLIAFDLTTICQFCGVTQIVNYSNSVFESTGLSENTARVCTLILGIVNLVGPTCIAFTQRKINRRNILLAGLALLCCLDIAIAITFLFDASNATATLIIIFIAVYSATLGSFTFILLPEIVPNLGTSIAYLWNILMMFVSAFTFLFISNTAHFYGAFFIYGGALLVSFIHCCVALPRGKKESIGAVFTRYAKAERAPVIIEDNRIAVSIPELDQNLDQNASLKEYSDVLRRANLGRVVNM